MIALFVIRRWWRVTLAGICCRLLPHHCSSNVCDKLQYPSHLLSAGVRHPRRRHKSTTTAHNDSVVDDRDDEADHGDVAADAAVDNNDKLGWS